VNHLSKYQASFPPCHLPHVLLDGALNCATVKLFHHHDSFRTAHNVSEFHARQNVILFGRVAMTNFSTSSPDYSQPDA
jgi:hypothetical protein